MKSNRVEEQADSAARQFEALYGRAPAWVVAAPGRVNLIGEHTDYNDGFVLPMAIERYVVMAAGPVVERDKMEEHDWRIQSDQEQELLQFSVKVPARKGFPAWGNYVRGVVAGFQQRGVRLRGLVGFLQSTVPVGGGLSSSAALEVAIATMVEESSGERLEPAEKVLLCQRAEQEFTGVPCGLMDQFVAVMARADELMLVDCRACAAKAVPFDPPDLSVLVTNTGIKHDLTDGSYARRYAECADAARFLGVRSLREAGLPELAAKRSSMDPILHKRARHVLTENQRTLSAVERVRDGAWKSLGLAMYESHDSLRFDFEVSCRELDILVDLARSAGEERGVLGSRMTGGGFGGCTVTLIRSGAAKDIMDRFRQGYRSQTGIEPAFFITRPSGGACVLDVGRLDRVPRIV